MWLMLQRTSSIREVGHSLKLPTSVSCLIYSFPQIDKWLLFLFVLACHILECPHGRASEVLNSIGQAFEARFRQLLSQTSTLLSTRLFSRWHWMVNSHSLSATKPAKMSISAHRSALRICPKRCPEETSTCPKVKQDRDVSEQPDYYNVNPEKDLHLYGNEAQKADKQEVGLYWQQQREFDFLSSSHWKKFLWKFMEFPIFINQFVSINIT